MYRVRGESTKKRYINHKLFLRKKDLYLLQITFHEISYRFYLPSSNNH